MIGREGTLHPSWTIEGGTLSISCADHSGRPLPRALYYPTDEQSPRNASELRHLLEEALAAIVPDDPAGAAILAPDLAVALRELLLNSHVHGRTDALGAVLRESVRKVTLSAGPRNGLAAHAGPAPADTRYVTLRVCDQGPGMAARMARRPSTSIGADEDLELVGRCFLRGGTSLARHGHGIGLARVAWSVKRNGGVLGIRTGRTSLIHAYAASSGPIKEEDLRLTGSVGREIAPGTSVEIAMPLPRPSRQPDIGTAGEET